MSSTKMSVPRDAGCSRHLSRHGETQWNQTRRFQRQSNPALNERSKAQAHQLSAPSRRHVTRSRHAGSWMTGDMYRTVNKLDEAPPLPELFDAPFW